MSEQVALDAPRPQRKLWRYGVIALVLCFIGLLIYGLASKGTSDRIDEALGNGAAIAAPNFDLPVLQAGQLPPRLERKLGPALRNGRLSLRELRGTPFVLNLWASWCTPCRGEAKPLEQAWKQAGPRGVAFIGLDGQDISDDALGFLREFDITYPSMREPERAIAGNYGATGYPETFFVDRQGLIVGHVGGPVNEAQIKAGVAAAASGRVAGTAQGGEQRTR